ncbi:MAG: HIT family hydrolase [Bacteroidetes bacterium RIFCSPLOWO2_02_FULL_36_8]|nr:MAG: HIT family hydrolase [Bacteroidetes bacterium RIFCSPLOWO2_02_FULL_36_8]OFY69936.1 MAG: HIT family hydrolase [Bacteroidetes bacterium RIFCSPLOWO2_12_FULL_37_12]
MPSIFSKIANGEIPCYKIAEDESFMAFLDIQPIAKGHILVIPKKEIDYIFDLSDEVLASFHIFSKKIAVALKKTIPCQRIGVAVVGIEVPHAHIHLIPINRMSDFNFSAKRLSLPKEEMENLAIQIKKNI